MAMVMRGLSSVSSSSLSKQLIDNLLSFSSSLFITFSFGFCTISQSARSSNESLSKFCSAGSDLVAINASFNWGSLVLSFAFVIKASLAFFLGTSFDFSLTFVIETDLSLAFMIETDLSLAFVIETDLSLTLVIEIDLSLTFVIETDLSLTFVNETQLVFLFISPVSSLTLLLSFLFLPFDLLMDLKYLFICFSSNEALALFFLPSMFLVRSSVRSDSH